MYVDLYLAYSDGHLQVSSHTYAFLTHHIVLVSCEPEKSEGKGSSTTHIASWQPDSGGVTWWADHINTMVFMQSLTVNTT